MFLSENNISAFWSQCRKRANEFAREIIAWRREFHKYPELGFEERVTSRKIQEILKRLKIPFQVFGGTGVVACLTGRKPGLIVGLRADMDALPIQEATGLPFASCKPGCMHACGHDGHMATALGVAAILAEERDYLSGGIKLIFQPAEEKPPGGAQEVIRAGALDDVQKLVGFHYFSHIPAGKYWIGEGPVMAATDRFTIEVLGKGGHGSTPHLTADPILCASFMVTQINTIVSRQIDPQKSAVVSLGSVRGGDAFNIIPDRVNISGTVRTFEESVRKRVVISLKKICQAASALGCSAHLNFEEYCPATVNNVSLSKKILAISRKILGDTFLIRFHPIMGGEDFAFLAERVPACYIFVGVGKDCGNHHSSTFRLNESVLTPTAGYLACLLAALT
ncbi:MAG: amidohydrolase [Candidatus Omnitrophica bacterium]|nr:amidohydrolase [Candidatus Omnitrophota bacterium]